VGGDRSKTASFRDFMAIFDYPAHSLQETVLPMVMMESHDTEGMPFASLESVTRHLADTGS